LRKYTDTSFDAGEYGKPRKKKKRRRLSTKQKWLIAVCVVLAVTLTAVIAWKKLFVKPELASPDLGNTSAEEDYGDGIRPLAGGERKSKDWYTVLILGRDTGGGGNTDTMLLASYNITDQKATVMSIPRDTMVNVSWDIKRINSVYNYYGGEKKGINALYREISQLVGFQPDYQVVVEWDAVGEIVDAMGGVYFDVPRNMNYDDPIQNLHIHQSKGYRLLSGDDAMQVIRWRHDNSMKYGYADGDLGRIKTQQAFLKAVVKQLLQLKNITKINQFAKVFQDNVETDLSFSNMCWFGQQAVLGGLSVDNVEFVTMPNTPASCWSRVYHNYQSYVAPDAEKLLALVNDELSPFVERFTLSDLDIMSVNQDGSISSSTGYVEDAKAAVPPSIPVHVDKTPVENEEPTTDQDGAGTASPDTGGASSGSGETTPGTGETTPGTGEVTPGTGEVTPGTGETTPGTDTGGTTDTGEGTGGVTAPLEPAVPAEPAEGTTTQAAA
jgi:LCP family protein required for cell wall assembly